MYSKFEETISILDGKGSFMTAVPLLPEGGLSQGSSPVSSSTLNRTPMILPKREDSSSIDLIKDSGSFLIVFRKDH